MNERPEMTVYVPLFCRKRTGFRGGRNVDIVGVTGSIPVTPTIQALIFCGFAGLLTYFPVGSMDLSGGDMG